MKIKKLWVSKYKNIENIDLEFKSDLITLMVGKNGLGKSNLIEVLALIFRDLDLLNKIEEFQSWAYSEDYFEYEIQYECYNDELHIELKKDFFAIKIRPKNSNEDSAYTELDFKDFIKHRKEKFLPKYIVGYYSGENKRIRDIIKKHEQITFEELKKFSINNDLSDTGLRRLFFTENHHSQLLLLTLIIFKNHSNFKTKIENLFTNYLGIVGIKNFEIKFNNPDWNYKKLDGINRGVENIVENIFSKVKNPFWNTKGKVNTLLTNLYNHQIGLGSEPIGYDNMDAEDPRKFVEEFLWFNKINFDRLTNEIKDFYKHPIELFDALEGTAFIDILNNIDFKVEKQGIPDPIQFSQLSEGEQQLLTVLGLILVTGTDDCLFLLDEPDTHLNPEWQRNYVELLKEFNLNDENSHIFVSTHSPLLVQSFEDEDVLLFRRADDKIIIDTDPHQIKNWRIDQVLQSEYFQIDNVRPTSLDEFMKKREEILSKEIVTKEDIEYLKKIDEEEGLLPSGETLNDFRTVRLLREVAAKIPKE
jgi:energy-coupling factor transporter ATP-binding protein EcfA2